MRYTSALACIGGLSVALLASPSQGGPAGGVVTRGAATITTTTNGATIQQTSQRVVIDWSSFNVASGETVTFTQPNAGAIAFNRTPLGSAINIAGALNANGGVWLFSPSGLLIGSGARINVGSLVASTAALDLDAAMSANRLSLLPGAPSGSGSLNVQTGGQINATNGFVLLQAETLNQGGQVQASGAISYQAAEGALIDFTASDVGTALNASGAADANGRGKPNLNHTGLSKAGGHIEIVAPSGQNAPNFAGIINLSGVIEAAGVQPGGVKGVVILAGRDTARSASNFNGSTMALDSSKATITAKSGDIYISGEALTLGATTGGRDTYLASYGGVSLMGPLEVSGSLLAQSRTAAVTVAADISTGASLLLQGASIRLTSGALVRGAKSEPNGIIGLSAAGSVDTSAGKLVGGTGDGQSGDILISAGAPVAGLLAGRGGDLTTGEIAGRSIGLQASKVGANGGAIQVRGSLRTGQELDIDAAGLLTIGPNATVSSAKAGAASAWPVWSADDAAIALTAADLVLQGKVSTGGDVLIVAKPPNGDVSLGGLGSPNHTGFELTNAELQSVVGRNIAIGGGAANLGATVRIGDLSLSSDKLSALWVGTGGAGQILVSGRIAPTVRPVSVNLGFIETPISGKAADYAPERIVVTGALGTANAKLGSVRMLASRDILLGDDRFIAGAAASNDFDPGSVPVTASDVGRLWLVADQWQFAARGRVLQQNTSGSGGFGGVEFGEPSGAAPLVVHPADLSAVKIGATNSWSLGELNPTRIALSGVVRSPEGTPWSSTGSSYAAAIGVQVPLSEAYRMNGCALGCRDGAPPLVVTSTVARPTSDSNSETAGQSDAVGQGEAAAEASTASAQGKPKTIFPIRTRGADRTIRLGPDQVTSGGNRDLWIGYQTEVRP